MPTILLTNESGSFDVTELVERMTWSGDYRQVARTLRVSILIEGAPECPVGTGITLSQDSDTLFSGFVFSRTGNTGSSTMELVAYDLGYYLKKNHTSKKYTGITPEEAVASLCQEFDIPCGNLAKTGVAVQRKFFGQSLYEIIATLYTLAAKSTKKSYTIGFFPDKLEVLEKESADQVVLIEGTGNLMDASNTETAENMVNRVAIYDQSGTLLVTKSDEQSVRTYGVMQQVMRQAAGEDVTGDALKLLEDRGKLEQKMTLHTLGDVRCVSGRSVVVREPVTGLNGLFWIDSDTHSWNNGLYTCHLVVNFKKLMDEVEAGQKLGK